MIDFFNQTGGVWIDYLGKSLFPNSLFLTIVIVSLYVGR